MQSHSSRYCPDRRAPTKDPSIVGRGEDKERDITWSVKAPDSLNYHL
jgi:hypothetical protein